MALEVGTKFKVTKGCRILVITKGQGGVVKAIEPLGAEFSYAVRLTLDIGGRTRILSALHPNRLNDEIVRLRRGDPTQYIEIVALKLKEPMPGTARSKS
jgi:hypothetical protein